MQILRPIQKLAQSIRHQYHFFSLLFVYSLAVGRALSIFQVILHEHTYLVFTQPIFIVADADGDVVKCRWALSNNQECGTACNRLPSNTLDSRQVTCSLCVDNEI